MRSQLFGFYIPTHSVYEFLSPGPMPHVCDLLLQHMRAYDGAASYLGKQYMKLISPPHTQGFDIFMNEWDEETVRTVQKILRDYAWVDELTRMQTLESALSWRWPKFRETAVAVQFLVTATIDNKTNIFLLTGWNGQADAVDITRAEQFTKSFFHTLNQAGLLPVEIVMGSRETKPVRSYGMRADTVEKIANLRKTRRDSIKKGRVNLKWTRGCQTEGITPSIVKKYDSELHARWYDPTYV